MAVADDVNEQMKQLVMAAPHWKRDSRTAGPRLTYDIYHTRLVYPQGDSLLTVYVPLDLYNEGLDLVPNCFFRLGPDRMPQGSLVEHADIRLDIRPSLRLMRVDLARLLTVMEPFYVRWMAGPMEYREFAPDMLDLSQVPDVL